MKTNMIIGKKQIILASLVLILGVAVYLNWVFANSNEELEFTDTLQSASDTQDANATEDGIPIDDEMTAVPLEGEDAAIDDANAGITEGDIPADDVNADIPADDVNADIPADDANADISDGEAAADTAADTDAAAGKKLGDALLVNSVRVYDDNYFAKAKLAREQSRDEAISTISTLLDDESLSAEDKSVATQKAISLTDIIEAESRIENLIKAKGFAECMVYITDTNASVVVKSTGLDQNQATQIKNIVVTEGIVKGENVSISEIR